MMRGIQLDQSYGLLAPSVRGGAFSVAGAISGVQVEVGHNPFYAFACRSEVKALGIPYLDIPRFINIIGMRDNA
ncbi:hypothetical protein KY284_001109 [Solanum tuberosum]|nr:hypothetical protein KY284_001109 [Solanum tuberosum]